MARRLLFETIDESTGKTQKGRTVHLYENDDHNPEVFIDGMQGLAAFGHVVKINCFTRGAKLPTEEDEVEERDVACRLVMGVETFLAISDWLTPIAGELREKIKQEPEGEK